MVLLPIFLNHSFLFHYHHNHIHKQHRFLFLIFNEFVLFALMIKIPKSNRVWNHPFDTCLILAANECTVCVGDIMSHSLSLIPSWPLSFNPNANNWLSFWIILIFFLNYKNEINMTWKCKKCCKTMWCCPNIAFCFV